MINENQELRYHNNTFGIAAGMLVGALAGAVTMLLLAPQSGKDTRTQIQQKGIELRDRTTELVEDTMAQVRSSANKVTIGGREKIRELKLQGQELAVEQLDRLSEAAQAGKKAIQSS
jgi:gas vesicle protein